MLDPERSLVLGAGPVCSCFEGFTDFPICAVGMLLCRHIDSTKSTSGDGPENITTNHQALGTQQQIRHITSIGFWWIIVHPTNEQCKTEVNERSEVVVY